MLTDQDYVTIGNSICFNSSDSRESHTGHVMTSEMTPIWASV